MHNNTHYSYVCESVANIQPHVENCISKPLQADKI